jgi:hypothetical protein
MQPSTSADVISCAPLPPTHHGVSIVVMHLFISALFKLLSGYSIQLPDRGIIQRVLHDL